MIPLSHFVVLFASTVNAEFTPVENSPVTIDGGSSRGVAWGDYDNDGDPDIVISNTDGQKIFLYRNDRAAGFVRIDERPFDEIVGAAEGIVWVDYNNDGWLDLFVARTEDGNVLLRNNGGEFARVDAGPLTGDRGVYSQACWADFDNDGWLDAFLVTRGETADVLYRNIRGETFEQIAAPFKDDKADGRVCVAGDFTGNGHPDIYVGNFLKRIDERAFKAVNSLYLNHGGLEFERVLTGHAVNTPSLTYGVVIEDFDQDGDLDFFVTNISLSDRNTLYENLGGGEFYPREDLALSAESIGPSKGAVAGDFDCDGALDFFVAEGTEGITPDELARDYDVNNRLFLRSDDKYEPIARGPIVEDEKVSAGAAAGDMDLDGDLDLVVANWGGNEEDNSLYRNDSACSSWLHFRLEGRRSNRMGIGARVIVEYDASGDRRRLMRSLWPQTGYASANDPALHFALGADANAANVIVEWPSGFVQEFGAVETGRRYIIREGAAAPIPSGEESDYR